MLADAPFHELPVTLAKLDVLGSRDAQHGRMDLPIQAGIRRMLNRLGLHGRVHDDLLETLIGDRAGCLPRINRGLKQHLHALLSDPLPPARHLRGVDREVVLEHHLAAEVLPVRVLHPALHHILIRKSVGVLQQVQPCHQTNGDPWTAQIRHIEATELLRQIVPRDLLRQPHQLVVRVQSQVQFPPDHRLILRRSPRFWLHAYTGKAGVTPTFLVYQICRKFP